MRVKVKKWDHFQHYKNRNPPWVKLHNDMLTSETWALASDKDRLLMVVALMVGSRGTNSGVLASEEYVKRIAYLQKAPDFKPLLKLGFFVEVDEDDNVLAGASAVQADACASLSVSVSDSVSVRGESEGSKPKGFKSWSEVDLRSSAETHEDVLKGADVDDFVSYWMEPKESGKPRISGQDAWDTRRRMQTWARNNEKRGNRNTGGDTFVSSLPK